jgi:hypothetical protein
MHEQSNQEAHDKPRGEEQKYSDGINVIEFPSEE